MWCCNRSMVSSMVSLEHVACTGGTHRIVSCSLAGWLTERSTGQLYHHTLGPKHVKGFKPLARWHPQMRTAPITPHATPRAACVCLLQGYAHTEQLWRRPPQPGPLPAVSSCTCLAPHCQHPPARIPHTFRRNKQRPGVPHYCGSCADMVNKTPCKISPLWHHTAVLSSHQDFLRRISWTPHALNRAHKILPGAQTSPSSSSSYYYSSSSL